MDKDNGLPTVEINRMSFIKKMIIDNAGTFVSIENYK